MRYNKNNIPIEQFLNKVHTKAYVTYISKNKDDIKKAEKIQNFLQDMKLAAQNLQNQNAVDKTLMSQLLQETDNQLKIMGLSSGIKNLFKRTGNSYQQGAYFEKELEAMIKAIIVKSLDDNNIKLDDYKISTGQLTGTTTMSKQMEEQIAIFIKKGFSQEQAFKMADSTPKGVYQKRVQIKTDIQGAHLNIEAIKSPEWANVQNLFQDVTISAKSYRSHSYDQKERIWKLKELYPTIHLGNAENPYRAIYGTLSSLGYSHSTILSAYYAGKEAIKDREQSVINHMYHLKYIYELTGAGTKVLGQQYNAVRFLVYNDPTTDKIYVQSAASILSDIFDEGFNWTGDPLGAITISASKFE